MPASIKIKELAFVCHPVADVARARAFYGGFLGLKTGKEVEFAPGLWWIEYDVAGVALAVTNAAPPTGGGASSVALEVEDFEGALAAVRAAGVALTIEPQDFSVCRMFAVGSPDGYTIMFHQRKA
jgi:catechol 2,3-dioxygenase-like lactoylglutathione lyase family enzyme